MSLHSHKLHTNDNCGGNIIYNFTYFSQALAGCEGNSQKSEFLIIKLVHVSSVLSYPHLQVLADYRVSSLSFPFSNLRM